MLRFLTTGMLGCIVLLLNSACAEEPADLPHTLIDIEMQLEAGAGFFDPWPSGKTIHSGVGFIQPFGAADYWCGVEYEEAAAYPNSKSHHSWLIDNAIDSNPLFCIYRLEQGDLYALDVLIGTIAKVPNSRGRQDSVVNVVLGGTGDFEGASGVWVGTTGGRGPEREVAPELKLPASILKLMDGYVRLPAD